MQFKFVIRVHLINASFCQNVAYNRGCLCSSKREIVKYSLRRFMDFSCECCLKQMSQRVQRIIRLTESHTVVAQSSFDERYFVQYYFRIIINFFLFAFEVYRHIFVNQNFQICLVPWWFFVVSQQIFSLKQNQKREARIIITM